MAVLINGVMRGTEAVIDEEQCGLIYYYAFIITHLQFLRVKLFSLQAVQKQLH